MQVYHVTPSRSVPSIREGGIDPAYSQGAMERAWYVTAMNLDWAIGHVAKRHGVTQDAVTVIPVWIKRKRLTRFARGVWYSTLVIFPRFDDGE